MNTQLDLKTIRAYLKGLNRKTLLMISSIVIAIPVLVIGGYFAFTTFQERVIKAQDSTPTAVSTTNNGKGVEITWDAGDDKDAVIEYGTDPENLSKIGYAQVTDDPANPGNTISKSTIDDLDPNETYFFRIKVNEQTYDNNGALWSFQTPAGGTENPESTPSATIDPTASPAVVVPTPTPTTPVIILPTPTIATGSSTICKETDCNKILAAGCGTGAYIKAGCIGNSSITPTPTDGPSPTAGPSATPTPTASITPTPTVAPSACSINYVQANSCTSWVWDDVMNSKVEACEDTYERYFVQCKSSSFTSSDPAIWYCNQTQSVNELTLPCENAPTPPAGGAVFCRIRAETETGGDANATDWIYGNTACPKNSAVPACAMTYMQPNNCRSWIWDMVNSKLPACTASFDHYFLQCKNQSFATSEVDGRWFCNGTLKTHYTEMGDTAVCGNAPTPADGENIFCRVRTEDSYNGGNSQYGDWVTNFDTCPTSTPTPTPTYTPSPTPTSTNTPTPTPVTP